MPEIKNIIFDWSGTLFDDFQVSFISTQATIQKFGGPTLTKQEYREKFTLPVWKFYRNYLSPKISIDDIDTFYFDHFTDYASKAKPFKLTDKILQLAKKNKIRIFIYSTVRQSILEELTRRFGMEKYFECIVGNIRDKEKGLRQFVKKHHLKKEETLFIGDTTHDISAAKKAGIKSGALCNGYQTTERLLDTIPDFIWNDHAGLVKLLESRRGGVPPPGHGRSIGPSLWGTRAPTIQFPISTVGALIFNKGDIFLVQTHKWSHCFGIPGGKIKYGEASVEALKREIKEETGITLKNIRFAMMHDSIKSKEFYKKGSHFLLLNYYAESLSRHFKLNDESESGFWISPSKALKLKLNEPTRVLIESYITEACHSC